MSHSTRSPKVHVLFVGVKVAQWANDPISGISSLLDALKRDGSSIISLGDKDMTLEENNAAFAGLLGTLDHLRDRGYKQDRWVVVTDSKNFSFLGEMPGNPVTLIYDRISPAKNIYLHEDNERSLEDKPAELLQAIKTLQRWQASFNKQQPKGTIMLLTQIANLFEQARLILTTPSGCLYDPVKVLADLQTLRDNMEFIPAMQGATTQAALAGAINLLSTKKGEDSAYNKDQVLVDLVSAIQQLRDLDNAAGQKEEAIQVAPKKNIIQVLEQAVALLLAPQSQVCVRDQETVARALDEYREELLRKDNNAPAAQAKRAEGFGSLREAIQHLKDVLVDFLENPPEEPARPRFGDEMHSFLPRRQPLRPAHPGMMFPDPYNGLSMQQFGRLGFTGYPRPFNDQIRNRFAGMGDGWQFNRHGHPDSQYETEVKQEVVHLYPGTEEVRAEMVKFLDEGGMALIAGAGTQGRVQRFVTLHEVGARPGADENAMIKAIQGERYHILVADNQWTFKNMHLYKDVNVPLIPLSISALKSCFDQLNLLILAQQVPSNRYY